MLTYFDHTFFKIVSGFVGILAMSLALFVLAGQYRDQQDAVQASTPTQSQFSTQSSTR